MTVDQASGIRALAQPLASAAGLDVWDVEVGPGLVRVLLEKASPGGGVDVDSLAGVTRSLSAALDGHDELAPAGRYHLEVSSPGLERRLRTAGHYRRSIGSEVNVKLRSGGEPWPGCPRRLQGVLAGADDDAMWLQVTDPPEAPSSPAGGPPAAGGAEAAPPAGSVRIPYDLVDRTRTVLEWGPQPKPGRTAKPARTGPSRPPAGRHRQGRISDDGPNAKDAQ
jgi:ribosome maturation factor RimP